MDSILTTEHQSVLFALFAKALEEVEGAEALPTMAEVTRRYCLRRGARMAKRATLNGDPLTMEMYTCYSENIHRGNTELSGFVISQRSPVYENEMHSCAVYSGWLKHGLERYGVYFCPVLDYYMVKGFNPELEMDCLGTLPEGMPCCRHRWNGFEATEENWQRLQNKKKALGLSAKKEMLYHVAELYDMAARTLREEFGDASYQKVEELAMGEFREKFGDVIANAVLRTSRQDFTEI